MKLLPLTDSSVAIIHLVRPTWFALERGGTVQEIIATHFPAMSLVHVGALVEDEARVRIEATAVLPTMPDRQKEYLHDLRPTPCRPEFIPTKNIPG